jgi:hypothetical protein
MKRTPRRTAVELHVRYNGKFLLARNIVGDIPHPAVVQVELKSGSRGLPGVLTGVGASHAIAKRAFSQLQGQLETIACRVVVARAVANGDAV